MQKVLAFYDSILAHNHPSFIGVLRISLTSAKAGTDAAIVKLYIVTLTFLPINILTGPCSPSTVTSSSLSDTSDYQACSPATSRSRTTAAATKSRSPTGPSSPRTRSQTAPCRASRASTPSSAASSLS